MYINVTVDISPCACTRYLEGYTNLVSRETSKDLFNKLREICREHCPKKEVCMTIQLFFKDKINLAGLTTIKAAVEFLTVFAQAMEGVDWWNTLSLYTEVIY